MSDRTDVNDYGEFKRPDPTDSLNYSVASHVNGPALGSDRTTFSESSE